ncbi:Major membrane protein I [Paenibacillus plantiphilus]|uniref:Major membrane protein I n=1 Tax=Paenibacillus plantiphilus TaxID=2905650 RepID=A0ABN8G8F2_9BACL|nr:family 2A encapsulin nanocompartment shell protein [Paenibacillus plantiphilus]CAH1199177.1 Major membrane protein I [Paenibacillus plantiphilus]
MSNQANSTVISNQANPTVAALSASAAYPLANVTKTAPQFEAITPRWLTRLFEWKGLDTGIYRLNKVKEGDSPLEVLCSLTHTEEIPQSFVNYEETPREYVLNSISTVINVQTRVADLYGKPFDQVQEQLQLAIESIKEKQESQLINSDDYGLLKNASDSQRIQTRNGPPTPDDLDELISKVWKEPSYFLAHPRAIAAIGRECTRRGVPPQTVQLFGSHFLTWRGIPIIPTDKLFVDGHKNPKGLGGKTNILLVRTGESKQGVVGLYQAGLPGEQSKGLSVRFRGIDSNGVGSYLLSLYCSAAILADDAVAVLEDVDVGNYYDYQ